MVAATKRRGPTQMQMSLEYYSEKRTIVCSLVGDLDRHSFADFAAKVARLIRPGVDIAFDLSNIGFIDSSGLRALRASARRIQRAGGRASAIRLPVQVANLLAVTGIDGVISVHGGLDRVAPGPLSGA
jgi:anti-anti-sigma factor